MRKTHDKDKHIVGTVLVISFWIVLSFFFLKVSVIRPYCVQHPYKELLCVALIAAVWGAIRFVAFPSLFRSNYRAAFWLVAAALLLLSAGAEYGLVSGDIFASFPNLKSVAGYRATLFVSILLRNTGIVGCLMLYPFVMERNANSCPPETGTGQKGAPVKRILSERETRLSTIFEIVERNPDCNARFIAEQVSSGTSSRTVERCLSELRKQGRITYVGSKKTGGYRVANTSQESEAIENVQQETKVVKGKSAEEKIAEKKLVDSSSKE